MDDVHAISLFGKKSYADLFPAIPLMAEKDYFILFDYFTFHLPISGNWQQKRELNLFEETVLRMLSIGNYDVASLSENLCLPPDLVNFILNSLKVKEYITGEKTITDKGNTYIGGAVATASTDLTPVYVLVRRDSGEILPTMYPRAVVCKSAQSNRESRLVSVTMGSAGKEQNFSHRYIACKSTHNHKRLTNAEVHSIIRRHNNASEYPIFIPNDIHIEYSFEGSIFVHAKFILQEGYVDNVLSSLGNSYHSPAVLEYAQYGFADLLTKIKKDAVSTFANDASQKTKKNSGRYAMLHKYLDTKEGKENYDTIDELQENLADDAQAIRSLATAVEWALSYHLREIGIPDSLVSTLKAQTPQQNGIMFMEMAEHVGLPNAKEHRKLFSYVSYSNFSAWNEGGEPSLSLLFPIAIGVARRRNDSRLITALSSLNKEKSNAEEGLAIIERLGDYGKAVRHGEKWISKSFDTIQSLKSSVLSFVYTLLPSYQSTDKEILDSYGSASQRKLNAEVKVLEALGDFIFYGLPNDVRRLLIESARLCETDDPVAMITVLSSVLEKLFFYKLNRKSCEPNLQKVLERLSKKNCLPKGLGSVSAFFYNKAVQGEKSTLGALALAWSGSLADEVLNLVIEEKILETVNDIATMRGHGAGSMALSVNEVQIIQQKIFNIVKWLGEK